MASDLRRNVRIAACGVALPAAAALVWAVAPALSLGQYAPEPVNFEQDVPDLEKVAAGTEPRAAHAGEGAVRYLSEPFAAPKRFDLVGITDEDTPAEVRVRETGGEWSNWVETNETEPVWTGGSDEVQLRSRH